MSREIITIQGFRTVVHFFLFFFLELTNVDTIKHFFKFLTIHFDRFFSVFPVKTQRITFYLLHFNKNQIHTRAISRVFLQAPTERVNNLQLNYFTESEKGASYPQRSRAHSWACCLLSEAGIRAYLDILDLRWPIETRGHIYIIKAGVCVCVITRMSG